MKLCILTVRSDTNMAAWLMAVIQWSFSEKSAIFSMQQTVRVNETNTVVSMPSIDTIVYMIQSWHTKLRKRCKIEYSKGILQLKCIVYFLPIISAALLTISAGGLSSSSSSWYFTTPHTTFSMTETNSPFRFFNSWSRISKIMHRKGILYRRNQWSK